MYLVSPIETTKLYAFNGYLNRFCMNLLIFHWDLMFSIHFLESYWLKKFMYIFREREIYLYFDEIIMFYSIFYTFTMYNTYL